MTASFDYYRKQVQLLMKVLPTVAGGSDLALKGGTAINMFYQDMPRYSVDIDLTWLPITEREPALKNIDDAFNRITSAILGRHAGIIAKRYPNQRTGLPQIYVIRDDVDIKIETSTIARGTVLPFRVMKTTNAASEQFSSVTMKLVSFEDVYAGKICAALERKHPRDLFDIMVLYENEGISDQLFRVLLVYIACSRKTIHESISPTRPVAEEYYNEEFRGMNLRNVSLKALTETGLRLHEDIRSRLTDEVETFLISLHDVEPDFGLIGFPDAVNLPAVRWKLLNLGRLKKEQPKKHAQQREAIRRLFQ